MDSDCDHNITLKGGACLKRLYVFNIRVVKWIGVGALTKNTDVMPPVYKAGYLIKDKCLSYCRKSI